jgi:hypothetical protein
MWKRSTALHPAAESTASTRVPWQTCWRQSFRALGASSTQPFEPARCPWTEEQVLLRVGSTTTLCT